MNVVMNFVSSEPAEVAVIASGVVAMIIFEVVIRMSSRGKWRPRSATETRLRYCLLPESWCKAGDGEEYGEIQEPGEYVPEGDDAITPIGVSCIVSSIHNVKTLEEQANVRVEILLFYQSSVEDSAAHTDPDGKVIVHPKLKKAHEELKFLGIADKPEVERLPTPFVHTALAKGVHSATTTVLLNIKCDLTFDNFPFDVQDVLVRMCFGDGSCYFATPSDFWKTDSTIGYRQVLLVPNSAMLSEAWRVAAIHALIGRTIAEETVIPSSQLTCVVKIERRGSGYFRRYVTVLALLSLCALLPLIGRLELSDVMGFEVGLLFTVTAFQMIISSHLPVTPTLSIFDWYMILLFVFIFATMSAVSISAYYLNGDDGLAALMVEEASILFTVWGMLHIAFARRIQWMRNHRDERMAELPSPPTRKETLFRVEPWQGIGVIHSTTGGWERFEMTWSRAAPHKRVAPTRRKIIEKIDDPDAPVLPAPAVLPRPAGPLSDMDT